MNLKPNDILLNTYNNFFTQFPASSVFLLPAFISLEIYKSIKEEVIKYNDENILIINEKDDIDKLTKLAILMPSRITIAFNSDNLITLDSDFDFNNVPYDICCHMPNNISKWFSQSIPLFEAGLIQYCPNVFIEEMHSNKKREDIYLNAIQTNSYSFNRNDATFPNLIDKVMSIEIPYIYDVSLDDFCKIAANNYDILESFKIFFEKELRKIDFNNNNEKLDFELTLKEHLIKIKQIYKKDSLKIIKNLTIGAVTTVVASLFILQDIESIAKVFTGVSGGAGMIHFISTAFDYYIQRMSLREHDCYFLWLFHNDK